jgi:hypothetical protein
VVWIFFRQRVESEEKTRDAAHIEQRSFPRYPAAEAVSVSLERVAGRSVADIPISCRTEDVSLRGVRLELEIPLEINDALSLQVTLAGSGGAFRHAGRVAWCRRMETGSQSPVYSAGIEFTTAPGPALDAWRIALLAQFE